MQTIGRTLEPGTVQVFGGIEVGQHAGIVDVDVSDTSRIGRHYCTGALVFRRSCKLAKELAAEQHRMPALTLVARNRDRSSQLPTTLDNRGEGLRADHRMVG